MAGNFRSVGAGNKYAYLGFYDVNGNFIGGNTSAPSAGAAGSGMYRILGIKAAPVAVPENDTQQASGDDDLLADFNFASLTSRAFQIEVAMQDLTLDQRLIGKSVETIAEGLGVEASRATTCEEFAAQYGSAMKHRGPRLIEVMI